MELFLEFIVTIAVSFLFSFFLAKILSGSSSSSSTNCEHDVVSACKGLIGKVVNCELKLEAEVKRRGSDSGKRTGFVANVVEVDNSRESRQEKILVEEILNDSSGSCDDDVKVDSHEISREVEGKDLIEKLIEEYVEKFAGACECEEKCAAGSTTSEKIAKFETHLIKDEVGVAKSEEIEVLGSECDNEIGEEDDRKSGVFECEEILADRDNESEKFANIETEFSKNAVRVSKSEAIESFPCEYDDGIGEAIKNEAEAAGVKELLFDEDDDWEGIERTELDRLFGAAVAYVGNKSNADRISSIGSDVKMQLYGLHKIATEGPCHEPQPMALKLSARANWSAWKQLGNMTPEVAMEQYVTILSRSIPGVVQDDIDVIQDDIDGDIKQDSAYAEACSKLASDPKTYQADQLGAVDKRNVDKLMPHLERF